MNNEAPAILVVDDEEGIREALQEYLTSLGYQSECADGGGSALDILIRRKFDLVITDLKMPDMSGIELSRKINETAPETGIIVITGYGNVPSALEALQFGADDYILKPFSLQSLKHSINMAFEKKRLQSENLAYQAELELQVKQRSMETQQAATKLGQTFYKTIHIFGNALESRERYLYGRTERITIQALYTARLLGWDENEIAQLLFGAPVSDIGKLALPEEILLKEEPLSAEEIGIIRSHVEKGLQIVADLAHFHDVKPIIQFHHERLDGSGYPFGLKGDEIPKTAMLVGICDSFDAMTHCRPWRPAKPPDVAINELLGLGGRTFDQELLKAFFSAVRTKKLSRLVGQKPTRLFYELTLPILASPETWPS